MVSLETGSGYAVLACRDVEASSAWTSWTLVVGSGWNVWWKNVAGVDMEGYRADVGDSAEGSHAEGGAGVEAVGHAVAGLLGVAIVVVKDALRKGAVRSWQNLITKCKSGRKSPEDTSWPVCCPRNVAWIGRSDVKKLSMYHSCMTSDAKGPWTIPIGSR